MGVNSLPKTVTRQCRGCDLNPGPSAPASSTLTIRLPSHLCQFQREVPLFMELPEFSHNREYDRLNEDPIAKTDRFIHPFWQNFDSNRRRRTGQKLAGLPR